MTLILVHGEAGVGKSTQHTAVCKYSKEGTSVYLCMEVKDDKLLKWAGVNATHVIQYNDYYEEDGVKTLTRLEEEIRKVIKEDKYKIVILDGISDIRKFAQKEWIEKDNLIRISQSKAPRNGISGENKAAWAAINQRVMGILEPLINWSNIKHTHVFFTAQMKDSYMNDAKVGRQIAAGDWIEFDVDVKCHLFRDDAGLYMAKFTKLPGWAKVCDEEVPVQKEGLFGLLAEREIL
jgi:hypothetical protein